MLLDDYYQQMLHAPLPQPSEPSKAPADKKQKKSGAGRKRRRPKNKKDDGRREIAEIGETQKEGLAKN
jgi:hypothetical protein